MQISPRNRTSGQDVIFNVRMFVLPYTNIMTARALITSGKDVFTSAGGSNDLKWSDDAVTGFLVGKVILALERACSKDISAAEFSDEYFDALCRAGRAGAQDRFHGRLTQSLTCIGGLLDKADPDKIARAADILLPEPERRACCAGTYFLVRTMHDAIHEFMGPLDPLGIDRASIAAHKERLDELAWGESLCTGIMVYSLCMNRIKRAGRDSRAFDGLRFFDAMRQCMGNSALGVLTGDFMARSMGFSTLTANVHGDLPGILNCVSDTDTIVCDITPEVCSVYAARSWSAKGAFFVIEYGKSTVSKHLKKYLLHIVDKPGQRGVAFMDRIIAQAGTSCWPGSPTDVFVRDELVPRMLARGRALTEIVGVHKDNLVWCPTSRVGEVVGPMIPVESQGVASLIVAGRVHRDGDLLVQLLERGVGHDMTIPSWRELLTRCMSHHRRVADGSVRVSTCMLDAAVKTARSDAVRKLHSLGLDVKAAAASLKALPGILMRYVKVQDSFSMLDVLSEHGVSFDTKDLLLDERGLTSPRRVMECLSRHHHQDFPYRNLTLAIHALLNEPGAAKRLKLSYLVDILKSVPEPRRVFEGAQSAEWYADWKRTLSVPALAHIAQICGPAVLEGAEFEAYSETLSRHVASPDNLRIAIQACKERPQAVLDYFHRAEARPQNILFVNVHKTRANPQFQKQIKEIAEKLNT